MKPDGWDDVGARVGFRVGCAYVGIALGKSEGFAKKEMQIMFLTKNILLICMIC